MIVDYYILFYGVKKLKFNNKINIIKFAILLVLVAYFSFNIVQSTFAINHNRSPDVIVRINGDGSISQEGSLFGNGMLYPATVEDAEKGIGSISGIIRVENNYKNKIEVDNLAIGIDEAELIINNSYPRNEVFNSFIKNIRIKIEKGSLLVFEKTLVDYTSLKDVIYNPSNREYDGFTLRPEDRFSIGKGSSIDLRYILHMVPEAGNELEAVTAYMPIYINVHEFKIPVDNGGGGNDDDDETVEITEPIPTSNAHWAHDCIITLLNHHVIVGYPHENMTIEDYFNGTVDPIRYVNEAVLPERYITRAEAAMVVGKALGLEESDALFTGYLDSVPEWARGYIIATTKEGIFEGYPIKLFKPNRYITREEMIAVLTRAYNIQLENESLELTFTDKEDISEWALNNVKAGYEKNVIVGYPDNTYRPKNNITRAEAFTIICKLMGLHDEHTKLGN